MKCFILSIISILIVVYSDSLRNIFKINNLIISGFVALLWSFLVLHEKNKNHQQELTYVIAFWALLLGGAFSLILGFINILKGN